MKRITTILACAMIVGCLAPQALALDVGEKAPKLDIGSWVQGDPVKIGEDEDKYYLVEFWATWCPPCRASVPHLNDLQLQFRDAGLVVVGVTSEDSRNTENDVKRFVRGQGSKMTYHVAMDAGSTSRAYMGGVGQNGIPYAFLVDQVGNLVWHGSPMDPMLRSKAPRRSA